MSFPDSPATRVLVVAPVAPPYGGMALQAGLLEKLLRLDGVAVTLFPTNFPIPRALSRLPGLRTLFRSVLIWPKLASAILKADVVHLLAASWEYFFLAVCPTVLVARICGRKIVLNYRGGEAERFFRLFGWLAWPIFQLADVIVTPSEFLAGVIGRRFRRSVSIVPNILDCRRFRFRKRTAIEPKIVISRHLEKKYDIETALSAFRLVQQHYPQSSLWIAGTGPEEARLRKLVSEWGLDNVRFLGHVAQADLPPLYEQCDIFLNSSRVDNFPGALLEASGAGLVVITTDAGGIPFIYKDGETALLAPAGDWQGLAQAVLKVLQSRSLAMNLATQAAAMVQGFDWREVRKPLYRAYGFSPEAPVHSQALAGADCLSP